MRRHRRMLMLLRSSSVTTPEGSWVARTRCTPRLRPGGADAEQAFGHGGLIGAVADHLGEFVYDDEQVRERLGSAPLEEIALILVDVAPAEQIAPPPQFGLQAGKETLDQHGLGIGLLQVGERPHDMGQGLQPLEQVAALVVNQDEIQVVGVMMGGQQGDEGLQEAGLAGAGGAADHGVGAVAAGGGVLEVEHGHPAAGLDAERDLQRLMRVALFPQVADGEVLQAGRFQQGSQRDAGGQVGDGGRSLQADRGQGAGEEVRLGKVDAVGAEDEILRGRADQAQASAPAAFHQGAAAAGQGFGAGRRGTGCRRRWSLPG
jgi:hypothetical protein